MIKTPVTINKISDTEYDIVPISQLSENTKYYIHISDDIHSQDGQINTNLPKIFEFTTTRVFYPNLSFVGDFVTPAPEPNDSISFIGEQI